VCSSQTRVCRQTVSGMSTTRLSTTKQAVLDYESSVLESSSLLFVWYCISFLTLLMLIETLHMGHFITTAVYKHTYVKYILECCRRLLTMVQSIMDSYQYFKNSILNQKPARLSLHQRPTQDLYSQIQPQACCSISDGLMIRTPSSNHFSSPHLHRMRS
jgi:hypothetical protein